MTSVFPLCLQSWDIFFRNTNAGAPPGTAYQSPLPLSPGSLSAVARARPLVEAQPNVDKLVEDHLAVQSLIRAYQVRWRWAAPHQPSEGGHLTFTPHQTLGTLLLWGWREAKMKYDRRKGAQTSSCHLSRSSATHDACLCFFP